ncbi:acyl-CoA dehydrogenase [Roseivirga misakiensis]|uniref:Acyl-CoA dehydrogenase n=1 Tax=Roseivirga misakiensis TaxID=1563681 RepID=A0A1E5T1N2_9BACT|nr:acyl-CoA dehydrogenase [Roseivirga misakiensis]OEK05282.1 acyl-CoA dehydrogenase [Roseivirga misakiensis]
MESQYTNLDTIKFFLHEVHQIDQFLGKGRFSAYDSASVDMFLDSIKTLSDNELFPYIKEMDEKPSYYRDGAITIHPQFEKIFQQSKDLGLVATIFNEEDGGLQMPNALFHAAYYIMEAANNHVTGYIGLTAGTANLIATFGSQTLKDIFLPKMLDMEWTGTMCLTEPQAGSSLSDITTSATPDSDGSYKINGQKIFISSGDHQFASNIIHLVLARLDGAPEGTKGVSLFVVPKHKVQDGQLADESQVIVAGEFEKLGQRGYCTSHLVFEDAQGWLVGEENHGLMYMFQMMNEARVATGRMGAGIASAAYYASLQYARERPQGRKLTSTGDKDLAQDQTLIINHPDVKRMLLHQKAIVEGSLSLILQASQYLDAEHLAEGEEKERYNLLLELLTPVVKTYPAEKGLESVSQGLQVLGGYGFCMDFILQQYYRDIRIISIYEGTTGIQSLDLLGRKVGLKNGKVLTWFGEEIQNDIKAAYVYEGLQPFAKTLGENLHLVQQVLGQLMPIAKTGDFEQFLSDATLFMDFFGTVVIGWQWLKIATASQKALSENSEQQVLLEGKIHTMKFFYKYEMSRTKGLAQTITDELKLTLDFDLEMLD